MKSGNAISGCIVAGLLAVADSSGAGLAKSAASVAQQAAAVGRCWTSVDRL